MTSQSSSLRKLSMEDVKQSSYFMIIHTILLMLISTLPAVIYLNKYSHTVAEEAKFVMNNAYSALNLSTPFTFFVVCIIGTIIGIMSYSYLYTTRSIIFYHSMPHKRETIYLSKALSGIITIIIPLLFVFVVNVIISACSGFFVARGFKSFFEPYLVALLMYVFVYSIAAFSAVFSSNFFAHCIVIGFIYLVYPLSAGLVSGFFGVYTNTFEITPFLFDNLKYLFPPSALFYFSTRDAVSAITIPFVTYTLAVSIIAIALGTLIYKKRKTENTNKFIAFDGCKVFLKYYITAVSGIGFALIFYSISYSSTISGIIGLVIGSLIVWCMLSAIFEKSFKSMFSGMKQFVFLAVILCAIVIVPSKILEKCDNAFPANAKKISISSQQLFYSGEKMFEFSDPSNVKALTKALESAAKRENDTLYKDFNNNYSHINVSTPSYKFWGIKRNLLLTDKELNEVLSVMYNTKEYLDAVTSFTFPADYIGMSAYKAKYSASISFPDLDDEKALAKTDITKNVKAVFDALRSDIKSHSYDEVKNSDTEFYITFNCARDNNSVYENRYNFYSIPIKKCYTKTLDEMRKYGYLDESRCGIERMAIMNYNNDQSDYNSNYGIDDSETLKKVLDTPVFEGRGKCVTIRFYSQFGDVVETLDYDFNVLPKEVQNFITENKIKIAYDNKEPYVSNQTEFEDSGVVNADVSELAITQ